MLKRTGLVAALVTLLAASPAVPLAGSPAAAPAEAACTKAPAWTSTGSTKFGISLSSGSGSLLEDLQEEEARFGKRISVVRTWDPSAPPTNAWTKRAAWYGTRWVVTSMRMPPQEVLAGKHDAAIRNFFSTAPSSAPIFWNYFHEPEDEIKAGQFTASQYRSAFRRIVDIGAGYCKSNLYPTLVLMNWTVNPASKLNWADYYPGSSYISVLAWDPYNGANGDATTYRTAEDIFGTVVSVSRAAGKPFGIAETGSIRIPGDSSGLGRAQWLTKIGTYLKDNRAVFVTYFQSTRKGDFELRDTPSVTAYKTFL